MVDKRGDICTLALYEVLADLANEAGAADTVIGRPRVLYERLCSLRDTVGAAKTSAPASALPAEWLVKVRRLVQGFEHVSGIARLWEPDYSTGSERAMWNKARVNGHLTVLPGLVKRRAAEAALYLAS